MRRAILIGLLSLVSLLAGSVAAQATVVNVGGQRYGVSLVPGGSSTLATAGISVVTPSGLCSDPWLSSDFALPSGALCWQAGGAVLHANETFAITWDPIRSFWSTTRDYLETFLKNVAVGSGTLSSPYAVTAQYHDSAGSAGRAANKSVYGGGCIDYGVRGQSTCRFPNAIASAAGRNYPSSGACPLTYCISDSAIQVEISAMVTEMGLSGRTQPGYSPVLAVLIPPSVQVCIDAAGNLCSANGTSTAQFCSYHSFVTVDGKRYPYVVQPWTTYTDCDPLNLPALSNPPTAEQVSVDAGKRLVNPLSVGQIAAIVNPWLNGWIALDGSEISDRCPRADLKVDTDTVGSSAYVIQRAFNNAGAIESDPNAQVCAADVQLAPTFVAPSPIDAGDVVAFDGSVTPSTLLIPQSGYAWNFGDGTPPATGASVIHTFAHGGTFKVTLTVIDRGGDTASFSQSVPVLGPTGSPPPPGGGGTTHHSGLHARIQLVPQGLRSALRNGVALRVSSNQPADGIATLLISRKAASRAGIPHGRGATVVIGRGTVRGIKNGTVRLRLRVSRAIAKKLRHLTHVSMTVRLSLFAAGGEHLAIDAAGRY